MSNDIESRVLEFAEEACCHVDTRSLATFAQHERRSAVREFIAIVRRDVAPSDLYDETFSEMFKEMFGEEL